MAEQAAEALGQTLAPLPDGLKAGPTTDAATAEPAAAILRASSLARVLASPPPNEGRLAHVGSARVSLSPDLEACLGPSLSPRSFMTAPHFFRAATHTYTAGQSLGSAVRPRLGSVSSDCQAA